MINSKIPTVRWTGEELYILDQTLIPVTVKEIKLNTEEEAYNAIKELKVRGAPAIGVAAAYSLLIDLKSKIQLSSDEFIKFVDKRAKYLNSSRPTNAFSILLFPSNLNGFVTIPTVNEPIS